MGPRGCGKLREYTIFWRMALVITSHHKYVQLSSSNLIRSRMGVVIDARALVSYNYSQTQTHAALWTAAVKLLQ